MISFFKRLFCKHYKVTFVRNIYGDEINELNCRSLWVCTKCGDFVKGEFLENHHDHRG